MWSLNRDLLRSLPKIMKVKKVKPVLSAIALLILGGLDTMHSPEFSKNNWDTATNGEYGFEIVAEIDSKFHILGCAATVKIEKLARKD